MYITWIWIFLHSGIQSGKETDAGRQRLNWALESLFTFNLLIFRTKQWRIQGRRSGYPLFLDQTEACRGEKKKIGDPSPLSQGLDDPHPPISRTGSSTAKQGTWHKQNQYKWWTVLILLPQELQTQSNLSSARNILLAIQHFHTYSFVRIKLTCTSNDPGAKTSSRFQYDHPKNQIIDTQTTVTSHRRREP